ncbi:MAG: DUF2334 domain-containing protein [Thiobacillaceae bacterium]
MINIAIRFDDPSAISDHTIERGIISVFAQYQVCATFAVIPCQTGQWINADNMSHLIQAQHAGWVEIAQHGYQHEELNEATMPPTEFADFTPDVQISKIIKGQAALEAVFACPIRGFVPPFNTYDATTVTALEKQGFQYLSAGWEQHTAASASTLLAVLPRTCQIHELQLAVCEAQRRPHAEQTIIAVMHHYDFIEHAPKTGKLTLPGFASLLDWLHHQSGIKLTNLASLSTQRSAPFWSQAVQRHQIIAGRYWRIAHLLPRRSLLHKSLWHYLRLPR